MENRNIHDTLHEFKQLVWFATIVLLVILVLNFFFVWEPVDSNAAQTKSIPFDALDITYTVPGNLVVEDVISGLSPLKLSDDVVFVDGEDNELYKLYVQGMGSQGAKLLQIGGTAFDETLVIETTEANNANFMHLTFFDFDRGRPSLTLNTGTSTRASVFENSLMIGIGSTTLDANYTICSTHGALNIDCDTVGTGGDLFVKDDIEAGGDLFVQGNITVDTLTATSVAILATSTTIVNGEIDYLSSYMFVLGEGATNDDLDTISGGMQLCVKISRT